MDKTTKSQDAPVILIVDDEQDVVEFLASALDTAGWQIGRAHNGVEAVLEILDDDWDAVLMDVGMPELNGINALKIIRQLAPDLPVVLFTGQASQNDMHEATRLGVSACLLKPIALDKLLNTLKQILENSSNRLSLIEASSEVTTFLS